MRTLPFLFVVSLGFTLACAGLGADGTGESDGTGGGAGGGGGGGGGGGDDAGPCGAFAAYADGRWWTFAYDDGNMTGEWTTTVTEFDGSSGVTVTEGEYDGAGYWQTMVTTTEFTCSGGPVTTRIVTEYEGESNGYAYSGRSVTTYEDPEASMPTDIAVGDTWTVRFRGTTRTEGADPYDFDTTVSYEAADEDTISVEAGEWSALQIVSTSEDGTDSAQWTARGVGTIKGLGFELVDWSG
jgi:hypothetical protein